MIKKHFLILISASIIGFPALVFAQTYEIYTYGSGDFLASIFNGVKMLIEGGHLNSLIKILLIVGLIMGVLSPIMGFFGSRGGGYTAHGAESFLALIKTGIIAALIVYGLMIPKANIAIVDRADPSQSQVVTDVPMVNAFIAYVSSMVGDVVGKEVEDVVVPVDAVRFRKNGVALGAKYLNEILDLEPPGAPVEYGGSNNVSISMVLGEYFERCVFPNFAYISGSNSTEALGLRYLHQSPNLLEDLPNLGGPFRDPNTYFNVNFDESNPLTCATAPGQINYYWNTIFSGWLKQVNYKLLGGNPEDEGYLVTIQELFERYFPDSIGTFQDQIKQLAVLNAIRYALISYAARNGDYYIKDMLTEQKTGSGWIEAGRLFNKIVQTMRMLIEAMVYGASIFLPVFIAITGLGAFITFVKINFWLQMWVPFYVLLNAFSDWQFARVINDVLYNPQMDSGFYGISFATVESVRSHANLILGYIGSFSWSVPALAWGLLKGGEYAVTHALNTISSGSGGQQTAHQVGGEVGGAANVHIGGQDMGRHRFMDTTFIGSQAHMVQGLTHAEAIRQVLKGASGGNITSLIARMGMGQAVDTAKQIGRGETYGGNLQRALGVAGIGERRTIAEAETFKAIADQHGGIEGFQSAISAKDLTRVGTVLGDYASRMGVSIGEAARQVGGLMGTRELAETLGLKNALGVVGRGGLELAETQRFLGEVARAEQSYQIARWAGYAGSREDFLGMFKGHLARHAEERWTLQDQGVVDRLNQMASQQGLATRFNVGDRVTMAWTSGPEGQVERVSLARGEAGAEREALDLTRSIRGIQEWSGREAQHLNLVSGRGVIGLDQPGIFNAVTFAGLLRQSGVDQVARSLARDIGKGRQVSLESAMFDPESGKLVSFALRRGGSNVVEDYSRTQTGWESKTLALSTTQTGVISKAHDERRSIFERGPVTSPSSMWSSAISGDDTIGQRVLTAQTNAQKFQEMQEQAVKFAQAQAERLSKVGMLISEAQYGLHGSAGGGIKFWKIGISGEATAGISGINREQENYNRIYRDIRKAQDSLLDKLNSGELKNEEFVGQYTKTFQDYATEADRLVKEMGDEKFGASSMVTRPFGSDKVGDIITGAAKSISEEQKGFKDWPDEGNKQPGLGP